MKITKIREEAYRRLSKTQVSTFGIYHRERLVEQCSTNTLYHEVYACIP
jgi:hypothetical protein